MERVGASILHGQLPAPHSFALLLLCSLISINVDGQLSFGALFMGDTTSR